MRFLVILERRVSGQLPSGQVEDGDFVQFDEDYASIEDIVSREFAGAGAQVQAQGTTRIRMRWRDDVDETCRIRRCVNYDVSPQVYETYDIAGPPQVDMRTGRREMILSCTKVRAEGWRGT